MGSERLNGKQPKIDRKIVDSEQVLPPSQGCDADWHERIERAKRAREQGKKARENKPPSFILNRSE